MAVTMTDAPARVGACELARTMARMARFVLSVPDMSCDHCRRTITDAVKSVDGAAAVDVDLTTRHVTVETDDDIASVEAAIAEAGYAVEGAT